MKTFVWHIDRAKFEFGDPDDYEAWKKSKVVRFEMDPSVSTHVSNCGAEDTLMTLRVLRLT